MANPFQVLYEDNHLLVVNKPALLATMGVSTGETSLVTQAKDYIKQKHSKPGNVYLGVVSRLDSFVSGVVVLARTSKAAARLNEQFRNATVEKVYWAIVPNCLPAPQSHLHDWLVKNDAKRRMIVVNQNHPQFEQAKQARLEYKTLGTRGNQCLLQVQPETGRKHQIRVQLETIGCPIIGDRKYGSDIPFRRGIALHSRRLVINHPTLKKQMTFEAAPGQWWDLGGFGELSN